MLFNQIFFLPATLFFLHAKSLCPRHERVGVSDPAYSLFSAEGRFPPRRITRCLALVPHHFHIITLKAPIGSENSQTLDLRLGHEHPVERVAVVQRQRAITIAVLLQNG